MHNFTNGNDYRLFILLQQVFIDHDTCTNNFLYRPKHQVLHNGTVEKHPKTSLNILIIS